MSRNSITTKHKQTKLLATIEALSLPGLQVSPYFSSGRGAFKNINMAKVKFLGYSAAGNPAGSFAIWDNSNNYFATFQEGTAINNTDVTRADVLTTIYNATNSALQSDSGFTFALSDWDFYTPLYPVVPIEPSSYQTIISQTGTAAPAVSGSLTPTSTYPSGTTFTWARTGVGVYTLTASTAVFNTSGKTGVFITPPQNLNGSFRAVVTSTTVITVTTAVQSLAVLGLLGFTAVNTDALLNNTMVYVQTYS